jgi:hypothetical protein
MVIHRVCASFITMGVICIYDHVFCFVHLVWVSFQLFCEPNAMSIACE